MRNANRALSDPLQKENPETAFSSKSLSQLSIQGLINTAERHLANVNINELSDKQSCLVTVQDPTQFVCKGVLVKIWKGHELVFLQRLINDFPVNKSIEMIPGFIAHVIMLTVWSSDQENDESFIQPFFASLLNKLQETIFKSSNLSLFNLLFWLSNVHTLLNSFKQYSGLEKFSKNLTEAQKKHILKIYDVQPYFNSLKQLTEKIFTEVMEVIKDEFLTPELILQAMIYHELLLESPQKPYKTNFNNLDNSLTNQQLYSRKFFGCIKYIKQTITVHGVSDEFCTQIFDMILTWISMSCLKLFLNQEDLCCWEKGILLKLNLETLLVWLKEERIYFPEFNYQFQCLNQICTLFMYIKAEKDPENLSNLIDESCNQLTLAQILKVHGLCTSNFRRHAEFGTKSEIKAFQIHMGCKRSINSSMIMIAPGISIRQDELFPVNFKIIYCKIDVPFLHLDFQLESLKIPYYLNLHSLFKKLRIGPDSSSSIISNENSECSTPKSLRKYKRRF